MLKKLLYCMAATALLASCTEDFDDWAAPQSNAPEESKLVSLTVTPSSDIDLATVEDDSIEVATYQVEVPEGFIADSIALTVEGGEGTATTYALPVNKGKVAVADVADIVTDQYGRRPEYRSLSIKARAYAWTSEAKTTRVCSSYQTFTVNVKPVAPVIEDAYYYIGTLATDMSYPLSNGGGDVYDNPVFSVTVPAVGNDGWHWFKIAPKSGFNEDGSFNWDNESNCVCATTKDDEAMEGKFVIGGDRNSWHIVESNYLSAKYFTISVNMLDQTYTITPISFSDYIYYAGDWTSWAEGKKELALVDADNGIYNGYYWISAVDNSTTWGFKFIDADGNWYGDGGNGTFNTAGGNMNPGDGGFYKIAVDWANSTYTLTAINAVSIVGEPTGDSSWGTDIDMTWDGTCWTYSGHLKAGGFKFRANHDWNGMNWGGSFDNLEVDGSNSTIDAEGDYDIKLYPNCPGKAYATVTAR